MEKLFIFVFGLLFLMAVSFAQKSGSKPNENPYMKVVKTKNTNAPEITKTSMVAIVIKQYLDTLLVSDKGKQLIAQKDLGEEFLKMKEGDNIFIAVPVATVAKNTTVYKNFITRIEILKVFVHSKVDAIISQEEVTNTTKINEEDNKIRQFLNDREIPATRLPNGTYLEIIKQGEGNVVGNKPVQIRVRYRGILMDNGVVFHQNMKPDQTALVYNTDKYEFLPICENVLKTMKKGDHIRLYIPSHLAFGKREIPNIMPSYSNLIYEFLLEDIQPIPKVNIKKK